MNGCQPEVGAMAVLGLYVTCFAVVAAAFYANYRLIAWWNRRRARTTTGDKS